MNSYLYFKNVYLCGPVSALSREAAEELFNKGEEFARSAGCALLWNPVKNIRPDASWESAMTTCMNILRSGFIQTLLVLDRETPSKGRDMEIAEARKMGIEIKYLADLEARAAADEAERARRRAKR